MKRFRGKGMFTLCLPWLSYRIIVFDSTYLPRNHSGWLAPDPVYWIYFWIVDFCKCDPISYQRLSFLRMLYTNPILHFFLSFSRQDDFRGLNQGVEDNRRTVESFSLMFEKIYADDGSSKASLLAQVESFRLLYPVLMAVSYHNPSIHPRELVFAGKDIPCDVHLLNIRRSSHYRGYALFLQRIASPCGTQCAISDSNPTITMENLFSRKILRSLDTKITPSSLSLLYDGQSLNINSTLHLKPMDFLTVKLQRKTPLWGSISGYHLHGLHKSIRRNSPSSPL